MATYDPLEHSMQDFRVLPGVGLLERTQPFYDWQQARREAGYWTLGRSLSGGPLHRCAGHNDAGVAFKGVNFASQDYLGLSTHPDVKAAAIEAAQRFGVHSAGSPALVGNSELSLALEQQLAAFVQMPYVTLYPTGWAAGFGVIKALVRPTDHVVMDQLAHACLQEGARAATGNVHLFTHNDLKSLHQQLRELRRRNPEVGILVVTESLFSMDSDTPGLVAMQGIAHEFQATLLVDAAHDLGCLGADGLGHSGALGMVGKVDVLMGSFSKTFASNGGFVACQARSVKEYLRYYSSPHTFSNALSPIQAAVVGRCLKIVQSAEGRALRGKLIDNILDLRSKLHVAGLQTYGDPSPIVCVKIGDERTARKVSKALPELGVIANVVEFPAVARNEARVRLQVMASHQPADIKTLVRQLAKAYQLAHQV